MTIRTTAYAGLAALAIAAATTPALAQDTLDPTTTTAVPVDDYDDDDDGDKGLWGLLGLLGLAGLLGRKRDDDNRVHVDRTNTPR